MSVVLFYSAAELSCSTELQQHTWSWIFRLGPKGLLSAAAASQRDRHMGCGASKGDLEGKSVTYGSFGKKKQMPPGVCSQYMPKGLKPGNRFMATPSAAIDEIIAAKGVTFWTEFKQDICDSCGGSSITGWDSKAITKLIDEKYADKFKEKGLEIFHCGTVLYTDKSAEFWYWLELKDLSVAAADYVPREVRKTGGPTWKW